MGFAEDKMWDYVRQHLDEIQKLSLADLLDRLAGCLTQAEIEAIQAKLRNDGNHRSTFTFMNELRRRKNWVNEFIRALRKGDHQELADAFQTEYARHQLPRQSQASSIPPPSRVPASPDPPQSDPLPTGIRPPSYSSVEDRIVFQGPANRFQQPAYSRRINVQVVNVPLQTPTQPQPLPSQQAPSSSTTTGPSLRQVTLSEEEVFKETHPPTQESEPAGGALSTSLTHATTSAAERFHDEPHLTDLTDAVSNLALRNPEKGDFESRLSQEESDSQPIVHTVGGFTPFPIGRGRIAISPTTDRVVRRKELAGRNGAQNEPSDGNMGKVTETNTQLLHPSPTPGPSNSRNAPITAPKSQIPRLAPQRQELGDATPLPAIRETLPRPVPPPTRIQDTRASTNTGVNLHIATRDSNEEEEDQELSKPGELNSVQPINPATQPSASAAESPRSSMHTSRLAIDPSSDNSYGSRNEKTTDHGQAQELSGEPSNSSAFTVRSDPLMISKRSTRSLFHENKEPEEDEFLNGSEAARRRTAEVPGHYLSDNKVANTVSLSKNVPDECDDANSMEDTRRYEFSFLENPSISNLDPNSPGSSPNTILPVGASSQGNKSNENANFSLFLYQMALPAIAIVAFLLYRSRQS